MFASWSRRLTTTSSPGPQSVGQRAGEVEGQLGRGPPEDDAAGVDREQVAHRGAGLDDDAVGAPLGRGHRAAVRDGRVRVSTTAVATRVGHLGPAGTVEVRRALAQGGEVPPDPVDVVAGMCHALILDPAGGRGGHWATRRVPSKEHFGRRAARGRRIALSIASGGDPAVLEEAGDAVVGQEAVVRVVRPSGSP